jgi:hypothetical protein
LVITTVVCDRCHTKIAEGRNHLVAKSGRLRHRNEGYDLCPDCASAFADWLGPLEAKPEQALPLDQLPTLPPPPGDPAWAPSRTIPDDPQPTIDAGLVPVMV